MGSQIFFPGATAIKMPQKTLKPNCTDTYCTEIPDYPLNVLKNLDLEKFLPYFNDDIEENVVQTRLNAPEEESLCDSISKKIYPRQGWTQDNQMLIIINHDKYRQGILVEECTLVLFKYLLRQIFYIKFSILDHQTANADMPTPFHLIKAQSASRNMSIDS